MPIATGLAAEISEAHPDATIEKKPGGRGDFIVTVDGHQVWNKKQMDDPRFPDPGEVVEILASR
ncbi:MAG: SelT/SelW/SelH family protein [Planctomycetes bacterium]|nr:SelT/SelW/SelH family protein [Planctomycetota bacterium]